MENIKKIASFTVNHNLLDEGIYVSRIDEDITTYDLRTRKPNMGDYMDNITMHSLEHMFATYVRNSALGEKIIYFGPMGCRTGFYLLIRDTENEKALEIVLETLMKIIEHKGEVFGKSAVECGNFRELDITAAKTEAKRYYDILSKKTNDFKYKK